MIRGASRQARAGGPGCGDGRVPGPGPGRDPVGPRPAPGAAPAGLNAAAFKAINAYLDHPAPRAWVVLLAEGAKTRDLAKNPVWGRLQKEEAALGFYRLREGELYQWLTREARLLGKNLTLAAAQRLAEMVGDNLAELSQELEKLALFAGPENALTPALVTQLASHSRTYNIFALVEALGAPGFHQRLTSLGQLMDLGEHPAKILTMLARQVRILIRVKEGFGGQSGGTGPEPGCAPVEGQGPGPAGGSLQRRGPQTPPGHAAPGGLPAQDQHRQPPALAGMGPGPDGAGVRCTTSLVTICLFWFPLSHSNRRAGKWNASRLQATRKL